MTIHVYMFFFVFPENQLNPDILGLIDIGDIRDHISEQASTSCIRIGAAMKSTENIAEIASAHGYVGFFYQTL